MEIRPYKNHLGVRNKVARALWGVVYNILFRHTPNVLFWEWRAFLLRCFGARIGSNCKIRSSARFWAPWNIDMGNFVSIGQNANLYSVGKIVIKDKVCISQGAYLCSASHDFTKSANTMITKPIYIESFSWIAVDAFVGMGVTIGEGAVVGARATVFKDVEPWTVVGGNPAKFLKKRIIDD